MTDSQWDKLLKIRTSGRDDSHSGRYNYPYEPTPYSVLERLAGSGFLTKKNVLLDYGCGKGRVDFYLAYQIGCRCIGVEYDERIFAKAVENKENAVSGNKVDIFHEKAENFEIPPQTDRFYFFNPFSIEIFQKVISMIRCSWYEAPREILLFFYYPFDDYRRALASNDGLELLEMIDCRDLEGDNEKEQIMICRMI